MTEDFLFIAVRLKAAYAEIRRLRDEFVAIRHVCTSQPDCAALLVQSLVDELLKGSERRFPLPTPGNGEL